MRIIALETSCDETGAAIVELQKDKRTIKVLSNITGTSSKLHAKTGGIIPEEASREQVKAIIPVIIEALLSSHGKEIKNWHEDFTTAAGFLKNDIDAIAVTRGPGLIGSLLVGVETAKTLSFSLNKPIIPVHHLLAHIFANFISSPKIKFPFIALVVSGGHTDLLLFEQVDKYKWLGGTRDDAAGECFDKCARLLGFAYPGGPKISKLAEKGNSKKVPLPKLMTGNDFDFSFSGLKTAFMNIVKKEFKISNKPNEHGYSWIHTNIDTLPKEKQQLLYDLCASLEQTIGEVLVRKTIAAAKKYKIQTILLGGGVSANQVLRTEFERQAKNELRNAKLFFPEKEYCTDNAGMIGAFALLNYKPVPWQKISAEPELYFD